MLYFCHFCYTLGSLLKKRFFFNASESFTFIIKQYIKASLTESDCSFYLMTGIFLSSFISFTKEVSDVCFTDYLPTSHLQPLQIQTLLFIYYWGNSGNHFWQAGSSSCEGCWWLVVMVGGLDGCSGVWQDSRIWDSRGVSQHDLRLGGSEDVEGRRQARREHGNS